MNILIVYPTRLNNNGIPIKYKKGLTPPLLPAVLDSLTPPHHNVKIINDNVEDIDFTDSFDLVAITAMTTQIARAYQIADKFRSIGTDVIIGGMHATINSGEVLEHADAVVVGEVEDIWEDILSDFENHRPKRIYQADSWPSLKKLQIPKWDNMNMEKYPRKLGSKLPAMPIFVTRGCPFGCKFCSVTKYFGRTYRAKPIENVIAEVKASKANDIFFVDDNIAFNGDYSRELFKALTPLKINWRSQISTHVIKDPELIELAAKSGCTTLFIGLETINSANLKSLHKEFNKVEEYEELLGRLRKAGIAPFPLMMFGLDYDTPEQFENTVDFLRKNKVGFVSFFILTPLPGTALFEEMDKEGRILTKNWSLYDCNNVVFQPKLMTPQVLWENYWKTFQEFYSYKTVLNRIYNNVSISRNPFFRFTVDLLFQFYFRRKVMDCDHPFSGGIIKKSGVIAGPISDFIHAV